MKQYPEIEAYGRLMELAVEHGLDELTVEEGDLKFKVQVGYRVAGAASSGESVAPAELILPQASPRRKTQGPSRPLTAVVVNAPLTGSFYRAPSPTEPNFAEEGSHVEAGQVIGLIEAMKVFSEVHAEIAGTVVEITAKNGKPIERGDAILWIDPD